MIVTRQSLKPLISSHVINAKKIMESSYGVLLHSFKDSECLDTEHQQCACVAALRAP